MSSGLWTPENGLWLPEGAMDRQRRRPAERVLRGSDALSRMAEWRIGRHTHEYGLPPIGGGSSPPAGFTVTSTAIALSAATAKTVLGVLSGANSPVDVVEFAVSGDATSGNILVELVFGTNASNAPGTNSTSFTPLQIRGRAQTINATAGITWTAEPTVLTVVKRWRMPWPSGPFVIQFPLGREPNSIVAASTSGKFVGWRLTSSVTANVDQYAEIEE